MDKSRRRRIEMGHQFSQWSGLTGLQCLFCGKFHIDVAYEPAQRAKDHAQFKDQHVECKNPLTSVSRRY